MILHIWILNILLIIATYCTVYTDSSVFFWKQYCQPIMCKINLLHSLPSANFICHCVPCTPTLRKFPQSFADWQQKWSLQGSAEAMRKKNSQLYLHDRKWCKEARKGRSSSYQTSIFMQSLRGFDWLHVEETPYRRWWASSRATRVTLLFIC